MNRFNVLFLTLGFAVTACACSPDSGNTGGGGGTGDGNGGGGDDAPEKITVKAMSFNIRANVTSDTGETNWSTRRGPCIEMIETLEPDVIGMQEPRTAQRTYLKENLPDYNFLEVAGTGDGKGGNTVLLYRKDRFKQIGWGSYYLSDMPDEPSTPWGASTQWHVAVWARLQDIVSGKEFWFLSTHLPSQGTAAGQLARINGVQLNVARMKALAGDKGVAFIVGDMNCSHYSGDSNRGALDPYYRWGADGRELAPEGDAISFNGFGNVAATQNRNIDFVFYRNAEALSFRTVSETDYGVEYISDHYPLLLTAEF